MLKRFLYWLLKPRWIVDVDGNMGLRLCHLNLNLMYYKWPDPMIGLVTYRLARKREFGESVKTQLNWSE